MEVIIICVPTPLDDYHQSDLTYITGTAKAIAPHLQKSQLVALESTTFPGTTEEVLIPILEQNPRGLHAEAAPGKGVREDSDSVFYVAFSPEREDLGNDTISRYDIPKVVSGSGPVSKELAKSLLWRIPQDGACLLTGGRRDDQAPRKHLSLR